MSRSVRSRRGATGAASGRGRQEARTLERASTPRGDFALRRRGDELDLIASGVFAISTEDGHSERQLVDVALAGRQDACVLIGGLGFGYSVEAALDAGAAHAVVVEHEPLVAEWFSRYLPDRAATLLGDARIELVIGDFVSFVRDGEGEYTAICADIDNGPDILTAPANADLYRRPWLESAARSLRSGGRLALWCADRNEHLESALSSVFSTVDVIPCDARRGPADVIYLAEDPRRSIR